MTQADNQAKRHVDAAIQARCATAGNVVFSRARRAGRGRLGEKAALEIMMTKRVALPLLLAACALGSAAPASAFQKFEEYRIFGSEISSVTIGPQGVEAPATLIVKFVDTERFPEDLVLESDQSVDDCRDTIERAIGDENQYVQIVVQLTADTMNGILIVGCLGVYTP